MSDGAHMGVGADRALGSILGGEEHPTEDERQTPEQMLDSIRDAKFTDLDYGTTSLACARLILEAFEKHPAIRDVPTEHEYLKDADGLMVWPAVYLTADLHGVLNQLYAEDEMRLGILDGLTGFMWGWAVNAVRYAMGDPPKPNPALMTIGGDS